MNLKDFRVSDYVDKELMKPSIVPSDTCHIRPTEASVVDVNGNIIGACARAVYYRMKGVKTTNPMGLKAKKRAELGKEVEDSIRDRIKRAGLYESSSNRFYFMKYNLSGETDLIVRDPASKSLILLEIKSFYGYHAEKQIIGGWRGRGSKKIFSHGNPKDQHLLQVLVYMCHINKDSKKVDGAKILYSSRDSQEECEFDVTIVQVGTKYHAKLGKWYGDTYYEWTRTDFDVEGIFKRYEFVQGMIDKNILPDKEFVRFPSKEDLNKLLISGDIEQKDYDDITKYPTKDKLEKHGAWTCMYCSFADHCSNYKDFQGVK